MSTTQSRVFIGLFLAAALVAALPGTAEAQRRGIVRAPARSVVFVGGFGPRYAFYDPFFFDFQWGYGPYPYGPWGPYGYGPYGPYGYGRYDNSASIRLLVKPKEAEVYVDGYRAGIVDSYDGIFQRLHVPAGGHEIVLYLNGYRTVRQSVYLTPGSDQKIQYDMEHLRPGEVSDPPPAPAPMELPNDGQPGPAPGMMPGPAPRSGVGVVRGPQRPMPPPAPPTPPTPPDNGPAAAPMPAPPPAPPSPAGQVAPGALGTLSIRVQPGDAEIYVDGDRWNAPSGQNRIVLQLSEGRHHIEVRKDGYDHYTEDVMIRRGATLPLNVSLLRGGESIFGQ